MLPNQTVYVHHSRGAGSDLPTRLNAENTTVVAAAGQREMEVCIVTNDKDARQLLNDQIRIYNLRKQSVLDVAALIRSSRQLADESIFS